MCLVIVWMTLINLFFWYGLTFVRLPASRTLVWSTSMQPLVLVVLGISGPPQHMPLASASTPLVRIVRSPWILYQLQPLQHGIPCETHTQKKAKTIPQEVEVQPVVDEKEESSPNGSDSEASSSSQSTSTVDAEDVESDLEDLEEHYYSHLRRYSATLERDRPGHYTPQQLNAQEWDFHGGRDGLARFLSLPATWPLARLMFPIRNLKKQMETLLQTYCFETAVTCAEAEEQSSYIRRMALHLGQYMAIYLAETITGLLQKVLTHPAKGLVDETNAALLTQKFWVQAIYTELLCASSRFRAVREKEQQRPPNGLVKVVCLPFDGAAEQKHGRQKATDARFETMIGPISWVDSLFIWVPCCMDAPCSRCSQREKLHTQ